MSNRKVATVITIVLSFAIATSLIAIPYGYAALDYHKTTYPYVGSTPNPVGVGEETLIHLGISDEMQDYFHGYTGLTVTVTKPDGTTETLGPFRTDSTGGTGTIYRPTQVGTYYLQTNFPAQWYNWTMYGGANIWFEAGTSQKLALNVTEQPLPDYPGTPLPTNYWTRPIDTQHYGWSEISGSWVTTPYNSVAPYNDGPETAHILWRTPLMQGGLVGGETGVMHFNLGGGGQSPWSNSLIVSGILLYNRFYAGTERNVVAVDLHTGKELWMRNGTGTSFGQVFKFVAANQYAGFSYWWTTSGTNWTAYDPLTGTEVYKMTNVPSGTTVYGPNGEFFRYAISLTAGTCNVWNSTEVVSVGLGGGWSPYGRTYNATRPAVTSRSVWAYNITIPIGLPGSVRQIFHDDIMIGYYRGGKVLTRVEAGITLDNPPFYAWAISLKEGSRGQLLWNRTYQLPPGNLTYVYGTISQEDRVFTMWCKETRSHTAYNIDTGELLWGPTPAQYYMDTFGIPMIAGKIAYGKLYSAGYAGIVYCYDVKTGDLLWTYEAKDPYNEILWSNNWPLKLCFITDGKLYFTHGEHSPNSPLPRGAPFFCLNATTGEEIFRIDGAFRGAEWGGNPIIGDSIIAGWNSYDNQIYGIGKGPSSVTVEASPGVVTEGTSVVIQGSVTDASPGTESDDMTLRFPNGVPAAADEDMSDWMKYVYLQFERPKDTTGVTVVLSVLDSNGNTREIGTTTSDSNGFFSYMWTPDITGKYTVIASFPGSKAYYPSQAETAFGVDSAPPAAEAVQTPPSIADTYFLPAVAGIIIAILVVGVLLALLLLRKRP